MQAKYISNLALSFAIVFCLCVESLSSGQNKYEERNDAVRVVLANPNEKEAVKPRLSVDLKPKCNNFLQTVLFGKWVQKAIPNNIGFARKLAMKEEIRRKRMQLEKDMHSVWEKREIPQDPWPSTKYCGYYKLRKKVGTHWPPIGTWCDPKGPRPCCNNLLFGTCISAHVGGCTCNRCADIRSLDHAELMEWMPYNPWCRWRQYTASEACEVIETSPVNELYYVGDSYMQSMYLGLLMILTDKPITGYWKKEELNEDEISKCSDYGLNYFKQCRAMIESLDDMRHKDALCGGGKNVTFKAEFKKYYSARFGVEFRQFMKGLVGRPGTYVVVGIGFHVRMNLTLAIKYYMNPAIWEIKKYYSDKPHIPSNKRWPQVLFSLPMDYGLLKPTRYLKSNYITKQRAFEHGMRRYCRMHNIPVLDFTPLAKGVHTFDGIHYGVGVNHIKNQILLNYLATLE